MKHNCGKCGEPLQSSIHMVNAANHEIRRAAHEFVPRAPYLGKVAYDGYLAACDGKSLISGAPLPTWEDQDQNIQAAWQNAAEAVCAVRI